MSAKKCNYALKGNCYKDFPHLYDLLYRRYLNSIPDFIEIVSKNTPPQSRILDMAAGTGEVSIPLLEKGYAVTSLDVHSGMLSQLKKKAAEKKLKKTSVLCRDICRMGYTDCFETVCIRQAINYLKGANLAIGLKKVYRALTKGGMFIFNAPNFRKGQSFPSSHFLYENSDMHACVVETNSLRGRLITHRQDSIIWKDAGTPTHVSDSNSFFLYTKNEFKQALRAAHFLSIEFLSSGLGKYDVDSKTLYCIAKK